MSKITNDLMWKTSIENYFQEFMEFFAPAISQVIDFEKGYERLDKELAEIVPESEGKNRRCDELIKVTMKDNREQWVYCYCHLEIQGYKDETFSKRMFEYYYRIRDRYQKNIYPLAVYTHEHMEKQPTYYEEKYYGMRVLYEYPTYSIAAQKGQEEQLKQQDNPFALVVLAGLYAMESKTDGERRYHFKKELLEKLYEKNWDRKKIVEFFKYLNVLIKLGNREKEGELLRGFVNKMEKQGQNIGQTWEWYTTFVEDAREEGIEKGVAEEKLQTAKNMLKKALPIEMIAEVTALPIEQVQRLARENGYQ